jgi:alcohol dehydrogenase (cytochrome c)
MALTTALPVVALAQSDEDLRNAGKNQSEILAYGMSYSQQRFSPLNQINRQTVK